MTLPTKTAHPPNVEQNKKKWPWRKALPLYIMILPAFTLTFIFAYIPMPGVMMAFQDFKPWLGYFGSPWVGFDNFMILFRFPENSQVILNTLIIAIGKIIFGLMVPFIFALLLNEIRVTKVKRTVQTLVYLPYFLSWVILSGILINILSLNGGLVNQFLGLFGIEPVFFLGDGTSFRWTLIISDSWRNFGFSAIIYLAALAGVDLNLYESAVIDGASRWKQTIHITIPALVPVFVVVGVLSLGGILNAGFDQVFNMINPLVQSKGNIIDTFVYEVAIRQGRFSIGAAMGLFSSVIGTTLIVISYILAFKVAKYKVF